MFEYKIVTQRDQWFSGRFSPEKLQEMLNRMARAGWRVIGTESVSYPVVLGRDREDLLVILERSNR